MLTPIRFGRVATYRPDGSKESAICRAYKDVLSSSDPFERYEKKLLIVESVRCLKTGDPHRDYDNYSLVVTNEDSSDDIQAINTVLLNSTEFKHSELKPFFKIDQPAASLTKGLTRLRKMLFSKEEPIAFVTLTFQTPKDDRYAESIYNRTFAVTGERLEQLKELCSKGKHPLQENKEYLA